MAAYVDRAGLSVASELADFIENKALPGTGVDESAFWQGAAAIFEQFSLENQALLDKREDLQTKIDAWHEENRDQAWDADAYEAFLRKIGYLVTEPAPFTIGTENVDDELARLAGPQLVVPVLNARYALNAANARWGSLYDAFYGTDAVAFSGAEKPGYDPARGEKVIAKAKAFLDAAAPLNEGSYTEVKNFSVEKGAFASCIEEPKRIRWLPW